MYARGDGDEGCTRVRSGTGATVAAPAWRRTHQTCRRNTGSWGACMVGWLGLRAAPPPLISPAFAAAPPLSSLPGESLELLYLPSTWRGLLVVAPRGTTCWGGPDLSLVGRRPAELEVMVGGGPSWWPLRAPSPGSSRY